MSYFDYAFHSSIVEGVKLVHAENLVGALLAKRYWGKRLFASSLVNFANGFTGLLQRKKKPPDRCSIKSSPTISENFDQKKTCREKIQFYKNYHSLQNGLWKAGVGFAMYSMICKNDKKRGEKSESIGSERYNKNVKSLVLLLF